MYRLFILALFFSNPFFSSAQDAADAAGRKASSRYGYEFSLLVGSQFNNWSGLNSRLETGGLPSHGGGMFALGFGEAVRFGPVVFGDDLAWLQAPNSLGTSFDFYLSTNELSSRKWIFSPIVGYGWQSTMVHISQQGAATTFLNAVTGSYNQVEVDHEGDFLDLGVTLKRRYADNDVRYMPVFRAGYRIGL